MPGDCGMGAAGTGGQLVLSPEQFPQQKKTLRRTKGCGQGMINEGGGEKKSQEGRM